jgi:predicted RNase H-like nuclease
VAENPKETFFEICTDIAEETDASGDIHDAIDAMGLALTAAGEQDVLQWLPCKEPPTDSEGLPMKMGYRAEQPFSEMLDVDVEC